MAVVLCSQDLMVVSHAQGAATPAGAKFHVVSSSSQIAELSGAEHVSLVVLDLSMPSLDVAALVSLLRQGSADAPRIVAFGPHVHKERLDAARQAGCDEVLSRGEFFARAAEVLKAARK